jgi:hypothetical protein
LHAKVIKDRFKEEVKLLKVEMGWTVNYFHNKSLSWKAPSNVVDNDRGWACIVVKESAVWEKLKEDAKQITQKFQITHMTTRMCI